MSKRANFIGIVGLCLLALNVCWVLPSLYDEGRLAELLVVSGLLALTGAAFGGLVAFELCIHTLEDYRRLISQASVLLDAHASVAKDKGLMEDVKKMVDKIQNNEQQ